MSPQASWEDVVTAIRDVTQGPERPLVVGIDGPSGAGKSTLAAKIAAELTDRVAVVVEGDDFYADIDWALRAAFSPAEAYKRNYDWTRLRDQVLAPARAGRRTLRYQRYDWDNERLGAWVELDAPAVLIVEGAYTLRPELIGLIDLGVYVEAERDLRLARQYARHATYDPAIAARQDDMVERWDAAEQHYIRTHAPKEAATLRISGVDDGAKSAL